MAASAQAASQGLPHLQEPGLEQAETRANSQTGAGDRVNSLSPCPIIGIEAKLCDLAHLQVSPALIQGFPHSVLRGNPMLSKVTHRKPVPFQPHAHVPSYLLCYVVETLACGHSLITHPQGDPLIAVRRDCKKCDGAQVLEFPAPGKKAA